MDALVGKAQKRRLPGRDAQAFQRGQRLLAPPLAPALAVPALDAPAALGRPLRPGVVLAVGDERDPDLGLDRQRALEQPAGGERLVVGVGGEDQDPVGPAQGEGFHHGGGISMHRGQ